MRLAEGAVAPLDGRSSCVVEVDVADDTGRDIARFTGLGFKMPPPAQPPSVTGGQIWLANGGTLGKNKVGMNQNAWHKLAKDAERRLPGTFLRATATKSRPEGRELFR